MEARRMSIFAVSEPIIRIRDEREIAAASEIGLFTHLKSENRTYVNRSATPISEIDISYILL